MSEADSLNKLSHLYGLEFMLPFEQRKAIYKAFISGFASHDGVHLNLENKKATSVVMMMQSKIGETEEFREALNESGLTLRITCPYRPVSHSTMGTFSELDPHWQLMRLKHCPKSLEFKLFWHCVLPDDWKTAPEAVQMIVARICRYIADPKNVHVTDATLKIIVSRDSYNTEDAFTLQGERTTALETGRPYCLAREFVQRVASEASVAMLRVTAEIALTKRTKDKDSARVLLQAERTSPKIRIEREKTGQSGSKSGKASENDSKDEIEDDWVVTSVGPPLRNGADENMIKLGDLRGLEQWPVEAVKIAMHDEVDRR